VDIVKIGWASAYVTATLRQKVALFDRFDIRTCLGGMMFEISFWQNKIEDYRLWLADLGIDLVEVSNGSLPIGEGDKRRMIEYFRKRGFTVLSEVGSKDINVCSPPAEWIRSIKDELAAGSWKVITEGRADASAGIYHPDGRVKDELIERILDSDIDPQRLLFEAPHKRQVAYFVERVGTNVNIGNIPLEEALNVETLRLGLRGDTVNHFFPHPGQPEPDEEQP
jgi:phosphosulfolactate synthase